MNLAKKLFMSSSTEETSNDIEFIYIIQFLFLVNHFLCFIFFLDKYEAVGGISLSSQNKHVVSFQDQLDYHVLTTVIIL